MTGRKLFNSGANARAWIVTGLLLMCVLRCKGDPLYLGPIEIRGSLGTPQPEDAGAEPSQSSDAALASDGGGEVEAGTRTNDGGDAAIACAFPASEPPPRPLPFWIDSYFAASGWAGDAANGGLLVPPCDREREPGVEGFCHFFEYTPIPASTPGSASWAGVFFQYPVSNWGSQAGLPVAPGAQRVSFLAAGVVGGEIVTFRAGGIGDPANGLTCADDFSRDLTVRLTTDFERYEIDLTGVQYTRVISPFSWKISKVLFTGQTPEKISFYLDDLRWE